METENVELELVQGVWQVEYKEKKGTTKEDYPRVNVKKDEGPHFIVFTIKGSGKAKFSADPIWVKDGGKPQGKLDHDQIAAWKVQPGGKKLVVFDWNDRPAEIHYQLNFDNAPKLDPIIDNGGGTGGHPAPPPPPPPPTGVMGTDVSAVQIVAAVLLVLLGVLIGRMWARA